MTNNQRQHWHHQYRQAKHLGHLERARELAEIIGLNLRRATP